MKPLTPHWVDITARKIIAAVGDKPSYTVASGITPSGTVHIGNFREVITVDLVARGLRSLGKEVRFIYSWDDFDTFRKVPVNLPEQEMLQQNLRRAISRIPDPHGQASSYAAYNIKRFEAELAQLGIEPEYLYQEQRYGESRYAEGIRKALESTAAIKKILDAHRSNPLDDSWLPTAIYCSECGRDHMEYQRYPGGWDYSYKCGSCGHEETIDIRESSHIKLNWRTDWPMRWHHEKVDFEPGGKDHSSEGGSYDTAKQIVQEVWQFPPPQYLQYDFVTVKGAGEKMSSSSGKLLSLSEVLEVYSPQMIRWIFASQRPNHDFALALDEDVIKVYDEFDRAEAVALGPVPAKPGKWPSLRRTYELSCVDGEVPAAQPLRPPFRELCNRLQIFDGDGERTLERYYAQQVTTPADREAFLERCGRAWAWLEKHAPESFRYRINPEPVETPLDPDQAWGLGALRELISGADWESLSPADLNQRLYDDIIKKRPVEAKSFFSAVYQRLISRDVGPRLPAFLKEIGRERLLQLL